MRVSELMLTLGRSQSSCAYDEETDIPQWEMLLLAVKDTVFPNILAPSLTRPSKESEKQTVQPLMTHTSKGEWK